MNERLDALYRATSYVVLGPQGRFTIRIDEKTQPLDELLERLSTRCWAFVSACNPGSMPVSVEANRGQQADLAREVRHAGFKLCVGQGISDDGAWPPEPSLLILGISPEDAAALGRRYGQNAIVIGEMGEPARLLWL